MIFVPFADGHPDGDPIDVLTGFVTDNGEAKARPVGVAVDARGGLLVADVPAARFGGSARSGNGSRHTGATSV